jgi:hypothetical protein
VSTNTEVAVAIERVADLIAALLMHECGSPVFMGNTGEPAAEYFARAYPEAYELACQRIRAELMERQAHGIITPLEVVELERRIQQ